MAEKKAYSEPSDVSTENGEVVMSGPGNLNYSMTPEAAHETGRRMKAVAKKSGVIDCAPADSRAL